LILPDVELKELKDPGLLDFIDYTRVILNNGKYSVPIVSVIPTGDANNGESMIYYDGASDMRLYFRVAGIWRYLTFYA
jgi:hypothetical protein